MNKKLSHKKEIGMALAAATCGLLSGHTAAADNKDPGTWDFDMAVLYYGEGDSRVQAVEPVISATRYFEDEKTLNLKLVVDTLTGASPTGATPSAEVQTFTKPSGNGQYDIAASDAPLDDTFQDTRVALSAAWNAPINRAWSYSAAIYGSNEYDYQSVGLSGSLSRYLNQKNTQVNLGMSLGFDNVDPVGGKPVELGRMAVPTQANFDTAFDASRDGTSESKSLVDLLLGVTQVINKRCLMQFNYSISQSDGYLTDPYKILSVIDDADGTTAMDGSDTPIYVYESRPDKRTKHALYWQTKYMLKNGHVLDGSYRFMTDDWGVDSHTFEFKYRWQLDNSYIEPHIRYYSQSEADFYKRYLLLSDYNTGFSEVDSASADYRLGELTGTTLGVKYGGQVWGKDYSLRLEYFLQTNKGTPGFGALLEQDLYPDTNAIMFTVGFSY